MRRYCWPFTHRWDPPVIAGNGLRMWYCSRCPKIKAEG